MTESVFVGLKQALADPKTWLLVLIQTGAVLSMSFTCAYCVPLSPSAMLLGGYPRRPSANCHPDFFPSIVQTLRTS